MKKDRALTREENRLVMRFVDAHPYIRGLEATMHEPDTQARMMGEMASVADHLRMAGELFVRMFGPEEMEKFLRACEIPKEETNP